MPNRYMVMVVLFIPTFLALMGMPIAGLVVLLAETVPAGLTLTVLQNSPR